MSRAKLKKGDIVLIVPSSRFDGDLENKKKWTNAIATVDHVNGEEVWCKGWDSFCPRDTLFWLRHEDVKLLCPVEDRYGER